MFHVVPSGVWPPDRGLVPLLLLLPVSDVGGGQPCRPSHYSLFLGKPLAIWSRSDSLLCTLFNGCDSIVEYGLDPRVWDLVQVLLNFLLRETFIHSTQKVSNRVVVGADHKLILILPIGVLPTGVWPPDRGLGPPSALASS